MTELITTAAAVATIIGVAIAVLFQFAKADPAQRKAVREWITSSAMSAITIFMVVVSTWALFNFFSVDAPLTRSDLGQFAMMITNLIGWPLLWVQGRLDRINQKRQERTTEAIQRAEEILRKSTR